jgi:hypothetical protein
MSRIGENVRALMRAGMGQVVLLALASSDRGLDKDRPGQPVESKCVALGMAWCVVTLLCCVLTCSG